MVFYIILLSIRAHICYFICMCYFCSYEMVIMKNLFRTVSVIALAGWFLACSERKSEAYYEIIPAPLEIRENFSGGEFVLDGLPDGHRFAREEKCHVTIRFEY